jgi:hypothetical protein
MEDIDADNLSFDFEVANGFEGMEWEIPNE